DDVAVRSSPFSKNRCRVSSPWTSERVPFSPSRKMRRRTCGNGVSDREPRKPADVAGVLMGASELAWRSVQGSRKASVQRTPVTAGWFLEVEKNFGALERPRWAASIEGYLPHRTRKHVLPSYGVDRTHMLPPRSCWNASTRELVSQA